MRGSTLTDSWAGMQERALFEACQSTEASTPARNLEQAHILPAHSSSSLLLLFGTPGSGKTFVGRILEADFGYVYYDRDDHFPEYFLRRVAARELPTRDEYADNVRGLAQDLNVLSQTHSKVACGWAFLRQFERELVRSELPGGVLVWVRCDRAVRSRRLTAAHPGQRFLPNEMLEMVTALWEDPEPGCFTLDNSSDDLDELRVRLRQLLAQIAARSS